MTTHYILIDDYDRWNPGEPIEDVEAPEHYLMFLYNQYAVAVDNEYGIPNDYETWLIREIAAGYIIKLTTNTEGGIIP